MTDTIETTIGLATTEPVEVTTESRTLKEDMENESHISETDSSDLSVRSSKMSSPMELPASLEMKSSAVSDDKEVENSEASAMVKPSKTTVDSVDINMEYQSSPVATVKSASSEKAADDTSDKIGSSSDSSDIAMGNAEVELCLKESVKPKVFHGNCPNCGFFFKRVDKHHQKCLEIGKLPRIPKHVWAAGENPDKHCPFCKNFFLGAPGTFSKHRRICKAIKKLLAEENGDVYKEEDLSGSCENCGFFFKRVNMHTPSCLAAGKLPAIPHHDWKDAAEKEKHCPFCKTFFQGAPATFRDHRKICKTIKIMLADEKGEVAVFDDPSGTCKNCGFFFKRISQHEGACLAGTPLPKLPKDHVWEEGKDPQKHCQFCFGFLKGAPSGFKDHRKRCKTIKKLLAEENDAKSEPAILESDDEILTTAPATISSPPSPTKSLVSDHPVVAEISDVSICRAASEVPVSPIGPEVPLSPVGSVATTTASPSVEAKPKFNVTRIKIKFDVEKAAAEDKKRGIVPKRPGSLAALAAIAAKKKADAQKEEEEKKKSVQKKEPQKKEPQKKAASAPVANVAAKRKSAGGKQEAPAKKKKKGEATPETVLVSNKWYPHISRKGWGPSCPSSDEDTK
ncbi:hypothetical protein EDC01DRAFT_635873 [Geopyxis carbonaria]|nr:hypothetical protein EDC01DRAFT_635873 [Geopyxis carbonaria]